MAIRTKHRRQILIDGKTYLWWVSESVDDDFIGSLVLSVASHSRRLLVRFGLSQPDDSRYVVVLGPQFRGLPELNGPWRRYICPQFGTFSQVTPKDVAAFVRWCTEPGGNAIEVDYFGRPRHSSLESAANRSIER
jgi:hypothetical protein